MKGGDILDFWKGRNLREGGVDLEKRGEGRGGGGRGEGGRGEGWYDPPYPLPTMEATFLVPAVVGFNFLIIALR